MKLPYKGGGVALFYKDKITAEYSILLGKRSINPGKGKWSIPGGGYESFDSNLAATAQREFKEETGIALKDVCDVARNHIYKIRLPLFCWDTLLYEVTSTDFLSKARISEFSELKFISFSELKSYKLAFGVKAEIEAFKHKIKLEA